MNDIVRAGARILLAACAASPLLSAAQWTYRAAPEPLVRSIAVFPNTPTAGTTTLVAATLGAGVFRSTDGGGNWSWQQVNSGLPTGRIWTLTTIDANTYLIGTDGFGIYKTVDAGTSWQPLNGSGGTALGCKTVRNLNLFGSTIYAATWCQYNSGLYRSTDNGTTWSRIGTATIPGDTQTSTITRNSTGTLLLLATRNHGIYKSIDSGATWTQNNNGLPANPSIFDIQCSTNCTGASSVLLAYVEGAGMYKSVDVGATWTASGTGLPAGAAALGGIGRDATTTPPTFSIGIDKAGLYRSTNDGANWTAWGNTGPASPVAFARGAARDSSGVNKFYARTLEGVLKTTDDGATWGGPEMGHGPVLATHDVFDPKIAYATTTRPIKVSDVYASNYDTVATLIDTGITGSTQNGVIAQDPGNALVLYATTNNKGVFKSTDGGASWSAINNGLPSTAGESPRITIDPSNTQTLYVGLTGGGGLYKSTNGGASWTAAINGFLNAKASYVNRISVDQAVTATLYAATDDGVYKSTNGAANWSRVYSALDGGGNTLSVGTVRLNPSNTQEVFIANDHTEPDGTVLASSGVLKSTNGGATWTNVLPGKEVTNTRVLQGGVVFAGLADGPGLPTVMRSRDGGSTWQNLSGGLQGYETRAFGTNGDESRMLSVSLQDGFYTLDNNPPRLLNISTRGQVQTGFDLMIGGFAVSGSVAKTVIIRAIGPSLANYGVPGSLSNPQLQLVRQSDNTTIATNDDWQTHPSAPQVQAANLAPVNPLESAMQVTLAPGLYTAIVSGVNGATGVGLVEVYEMDHPETPLINISTRGKVQTGSDVMIGGFVVTGDGPQTVVIRAIGPSLANYGVAGALANPTMQLVRISDNAVMATNDDWQSAANYALVQAAGLAPTSPLESAIYITLDPGAYTAIVSGVNNASGVGLVEVYKVGP